MKKYAYKKVNAFTSNTSIGNPAAYLNLGRDQLTPDQMLQIGKEHAGFVSEIVFCTHSDCADLKLTYYSSECEVEFCGHGTVATMYDLIKNDPVLSTKKEVLFETNKKGLLTVYNAIASEDSVYITAPAAQHLTEISSRQDIAAALSLPQSSLSDQLPIDFIDAGLRTLLVPVTTLSEEISVYPDQETLKAFCVKHTIDIILIFCMETENPDYFAHTRVFAPKFGYLEDPATGSGNSAFANYLRKNQLWDGTSIAIEQGGNNRIYNRVMLKLQNNQILFGGRATIIIDGSYFLY